MGKKAQFPLVKVELAEKFDLDVKKFDLDLDSMFDPPLVQFPYISPTYMYVYSV